MIADTLRALLYLPVTLALIFLLPLLPTFLIALPVIALQNI